MLPTVEGRHGVTRRTASVALPTSRRPGSALARRRLGTSLTRRSYQPHPASRTDPASVMAVTAITKRRPTRQRPGTLGLASIRAQGYATSRDELRSGAWGLAVPVLGADDRFMGSIGVATP